ncbi:MAG: hypothetical protein JNM72_06100 [Deltaproteobacteria bacterium]|nr:hypothetical protein [Deltaproteobacteria bacterium]
MRPLPFLTRLLSLLLLAVLGAVAGCGWVSKADLDARLDLDGDGVPRPDDCDDDDPSIQVPRFYVDADADSFGDAAADLVPACALRIGLAEVGGDCDDADDEARPGADELCNGRDDDCDGELDEGAVDELTIALDADGDGYGDPETSLRSCTLLPGFVANADDCDDRDAEVGGVRRWFEDDDGDGYGRPGSLASTDSCVAPPGRSSRGGDCDDTDPDVNPGETERCDGLDIDEDCDGLVEDDDPDVSGLLTYYLDEDLDGLGDPRNSRLACDPDLHTVDNADDCDDGNPFVGDDPCPWVDVAAGGQASCALRADARVRCWGTGLVVDLAPPELRFSSVSVGDDHACGVTLDGLVRCWGDTSGRAPTVSVPASGVDVEADRTCTTGPTPSGALSCWADGEEHQLRLSSGPLATPAAGHDHGCALAEEGLRCAGDCDGEHCAPRDGSFAVLAAGDRFTCALTQEAGLRCWGEVDPSLNGAAEAVAISAYGRQLCMLDASGDASCRSADDGLELATLTGGWVALAAGRSHGCGLTALGTLSCWGSDAQGAASPPLR